MVVAERRELVERSGFMIVEQSRDIPLRPWCESHDRNIGRAASVIMPAQRISWPNGTDDQATDVLAAATSSSRAERASAREIATALRVRCFLVVLPALFACAADDLKGLLFPSFAAFAFAFSAVSLPLPFFSVMQSFTLSAASALGLNSEPLRKRLGSNRPVEAATLMWMPLVALNAKALPRNSRERLGRPDSYRCKFGECRHSTVGSTNMDLPADISKGSQCPSKANPSRS